MTFFFSNTNRKKKCFAQFLNVKRKTKKNLSPMNFVLLTVSKFCRFFIHSLSIEHTKNFQFFAHTQQNDVYSFPRVAPNCKFRKNFTVDAGVRDARTFACYYHISISIVFCVYDGTTTHALPSSRRQWKCG